MDEKLATKAANALAYHQKTRTERHHAQSENIKRVCEIVDKLLIPAVGEFCDLGQRHGFETILRVEHDKYSAGCKVDDGFGRLFSRTYTFEVSHDLVLLIATGGTGEECIYEESNVDKFNTEIIVDDLIKQLNATLLEDRG